MKYLVLIIIVVITSSCSPSYYSNDIKKRDFDLTKKITTNLNTNYKVIECIDEREDTISLGLIRIGNRERLNNIINQTSFDNQIKTINNNLYYNNISEDTIVFQIKNLKFWETIHFSDFNVYYHLRFNSYKKNNGLYIPISQVDTILKLDNFIFFSKRNFIRIAEKHTQKIILKTLNTSNNLSNIAYTLNEIKNLESIEKSKLPLYNNILNEGIYMTYNSFKNQIPDEKIAVEKNDYNEIKKLFKKLENGKYERIRIKKVYGIVYNNKAYISNFKQLYEINKVNNDFFFTGPAYSYTEDWGYNTTPFIDFFNKAEFKKSVLQFTNYTHYQKIDYVNGMFIRLNKIEKVKF